MINKILSLLENVSLSQRNGRFLADKSYAFDTIFFISKFILHKQINYIFNKEELRQEAISYVEDIFQLKKGTAGAVNYFLESLNLLEFSNIISKIDRHRYSINPNSVDILKYISAYPENSYIFLYLLTYQTFKNAGLLDLFEKYCLEKNLSIKEKYIQEMYNVFRAKSISIIDPSKEQWAKQMVKYPLIVLGFINKQNKITRNLGLKDELLTIKDISLNVEGTRTPKDHPKKNDYLNNFSSSYVQNSINKYLIITNKLSGNLLPIDSIAKNLADLKLSLLDIHGKNSTIPEDAKEQYIKTIVKARNSAIQNQFRKNLFSHNEPKCPLCNFAFEEFLIASHIKPYSKCDDTYDAINHFNGFLLCPNHDKLFEDAKYMTIDSKTGKIILSEKAYMSKEYKNLYGLQIPKVYIENERRHYLKWHNDTFFNNVKNQKSYSIEENSENISMVAEDANKFKSKD